MTFSVIIEKAEDGWFVVECPSLPGCISQGKTETEALENIKEAIIGWLWAENQKTLSDYKEKYGKEPVMVTI